MRAFLICTSLLLAPLATVAAPSPRFENFGTLTNVPQIDAVEFINHGVFAVNSQLPYDFQNTRHYTNYGTMGGVVGFRFDHTSSTGVRTPASTFVNDTRGTIAVGSSVPGFGNVIGQGFAFGDLSQGSQLRISASNVVNRGLLVAGSDGIIRIDGNNVDLSRGGLEIEPLSQTFGGFCFFLPFITPTNFFPEPGIFDIHWILESNLVVNLNQINPAPVGGGAYSIQSPTHLITLGGFSPPLCSLPRFWRESLFGAVGAVITNAYTPTNYLVQAAFAANFDPNVAINIRFAPSSISTNPFFTPIVEVLALETNVVRRTDTVNSLYIRDFLLSDTNYVLLTNLVSLNPQCPTFIPANYSVSRCTPFETLFSVPGNFDIAAATNGLFTTDIFFGGNLTNNSSTNIYSAYAALVTNLPVVLPPLPGVGVSNLPGRVEINAKSLNLDRARIRGEGNLTVRADHVITSTNTAIDSQNLSFVVGSTNGTLRVQNLAKPTVERFAGRVDLFSTSWTNQTGFTMTNIVVDPAGASTTNIVTNIVDIVYHVLMVDGGMFTEQQVQVHDFIAKSTNVTIADDILVVRSFRTESESFTLDGQLTFGGEIDSWNSTVAPTLRRFRNNGTLNLPNVGTFGADRTQRYAEFVNTGTIQAASVRVAADDVLNTGNISANAGIQISGGSLRFEGGQLFAISDIDITGEHIKFRDAQIETTSGLNLRAILTPTSSISDAGVADPNLFTVGDGFALWQRPQFGDLFGTTIRSQAPDFGAVEHFWAGDNHGATSQGFVNNVAIGRLVIESGFDSLHVFHPVSGNNGLYVDYLEIPNGDPANLDWIIEINPGLVIYFANSNLNPEEIDGALNGRLRWVREYNQGPLSSVDILRADGRTERMNRALRESRTIDSDGDGTANFFDPLPLDPDEGSGIALSGSLTPKGVQLSWTAAPQSNYVVEYTTDLKAQAWKPLPDQTSFTVINGRISILDTNGVSGTDRQRFYRVRTQQ